MKAVISRDGLYRHILYRGHGPYLGFIMLNPSTADSVQDDPTIRKCKGFAMRLGYSGIVVGNLFQYRATKPDNLWKANDPVGPHSIQYLNKVVAESRMTIAAWGSLVHDRANIIKERYELYHIGELTKNGSPRHPLYLPYDSEVHRFG